MSPVAASNAPGPSRTPAPDLDAAMARYARGDGRAFRVLHRALCPRLRAVFTRMGRPAAIAEDLVQDTWLRVHRARASFAPGSAVLPWVYAIARNVNLDHTRSMRVRAAEPLLADPPDRGGADAEADAILSEAAESVERVIARLPPTQREAFVLLRCEGLCVEDAAAVLGTTATAVKLRAFRAYEALRAELGARGTRQRRPSAPRPPRARPACS